MICRGGGGKSYLDVLFYLCLGVIKTENWGWNPPSVQEGINMSYSMKCFFFFLRHNAASVLYLFSTGRTHWKLYSYTTKNTKEDQLGPRLRSFYMIERKEGGKGERGWFWIPSCKLPSNISLCLRFFPPPLIFFLIAFHFCVRWFCLFFPPSIHCRM